MISLFCSEPAGITSGVPAHFREDGLVLDQQKVLPAAVKFVQARTPLLTSLETRLLPTAFSGKFFILHMHV